MKNNPADIIKDTMWSFLATGGQKANIPQLKEYAYDIIQMLTQKTGGQAQYAKKNHIDIKHFDMTVTFLAMEAVCLVLSGELDKLVDEQEESKKAGE